MTASESAPLARVLPRLRRTLTVLCSLAVGLFAAEHAAAAARGGAFPFLDVFEADADLGVHLRPAAETRVRTFGGHVTAVRINAEGFRGPVWPAPGAATPGTPRVLLVGDSQVFGLHSEFEDTFACLLGAEAEVLDAGVPSYGPIEHLMLIERLSARFHPTHVVWLPYVGNDWQEATVRNARRTTATAAGFATLASARAPSWPWTIFPHSHLAFALRALRGHALDASPPRAEARRVLIEQARALGAVEGPSRLTPFLDRAPSLTGGAPLLVAVLPADVQADPSEWGKYRHAPLDTAPLDALSTALVRDARARGLAAVDLLPVLRAASPGAFLADDEHLSPRGHRAVATALRLALFAPAHEGDRR